MDPTEESSGKLAPIEKPFYIFLVFRTRLSRRDIVEKL
jgi:hypothetical protein